jgi:signal transduction histidine kinase
MIRPIFFPRLRAVRMPLRYKFISIFILAVILPAVLFSIILTSLAQPALRKSLFREQQEIVNRLVDQIKSQINKHVDVLYLSADIGALPAARQHQAARELLRFRDRAFVEIALLNARGQEQWKFRRVENEKTGAVSIVPVPELVNRSRRGEFTIPFSRRDLFISQVNFSADQKPFLQLAVPLTGRRGVLVAKLNLTQVWQWISEVKVGETGIAFVVDRNGILIAHPEQERVLAHSNFGSLPVVKDFLTNRLPMDQRWREYADERGKQVVSLYGTLPDNLSWGVFTQIPSRDIYRPIRQMRQRVLLWTLFWTAVFLLVGFVFVQRVAEPLSLLQQGVHEISQGHLDIKLAIHTGDEIEELAKNVEKMAGALKQLEAFRQDLIRMIIHDLKSPLSGIMGSLDYLEFGMSGSFNEDQRKIISLAKKSSESMLALIQNLLDVAKMEEGKLELRREPVDMAAVLTERYNQFSALAASEKKTLSLDIEPGLPVVAAERGLIERVINNLVTNALSHTTSRGQIHLGLKRAAAFLEVTVADDGAGIPPEFIDKIFEKFVQVKRKDVQLRTGAGLGLTFCRMVVETHGGTIRVESELNKGSAFKFTLPV